MKEISKVGSEGYEPWASTISITFIDSNSTFGCSHCPDEALTHLKQNLSVVIILSLILSMLIPRVKFAILN